MRTPLKQALFCAIFAAFALLGSSFAQELRAQLTPLTAWLDLRPGQTAAQTVPGWVESVEFRGSGPSSSDPQVAATAFRVRVHRPPEATDGLMIRVLFDDQPGQTGPEISGWNELGAKVTRSGTLGPGLGLPSSQTVTFSMQNVDYLEVEAPGDGSQVRGLFLTWLTSSEINQAADFAARDRVRQPFSASGAHRSHHNDAYLFGVVTANLLSDPVTLSANVAPSTSLEFELERQPLVAMVTYEALATVIDSPPDVTVNGQPAGPSSFALPDLADPGYQGISRSIDPQMGFRYTGWVRGQKVVPGSLLHAGLNTLSLALSNDKDPIAVRNVDIQLKYSWEKLDYVLAPENPPQ